MWAWTGASGPTGSDAADGEGHLPEVMGAAPGKVDDYKEVIKLQQVIQGFRDDLEQLKMRPLPSIASGGELVEPFDAADGGCR